MDVLVNATTLLRGGGVQVGASFVNETLKDEQNSDITWHYALSPSVLREVGTEVPRSVVFDASPARNKEARAKLLELQKQAGAQAVFTVFGPAYVDFTVPHLLGVADPWMTHSTWQAFRALPDLKEMSWMFFSEFYKAWWSMKADHYVVEAEIARSGLVSRLGRKPDNIAVVPNTCAAMFRELPRVAATLPTSGEKLRLLYLTAYYHHKNMELIPGVAAELKAQNPDLKFEFVLTIDESMPEVKLILEEAERLGVMDCINNLGRVPMVEVPDLYQSCHIAFMPSLLETFSANYPEAMCMGRPLVASDMGFSRVVCGDAATYFDSRSAASAAREILGLIADPARWEQQIDRAFTTIDALPDAYQRYQRYSDLIRDMVKN